MTGRDFNIFTQKGRNGSKLLLNERETKTIWLSLIVPFLLVPKRYGKLPVVDFSTVSMNHIHDKDERQ